jgi:hypothetical protein
LRKYHFVDGIKCSQDKMSILWSVCSHDTLSIFNAECQTQLIGLFFFSDPKALRGCGSL